MINTRQHPETSTKVCSNMSYVPQELVDMVIDNLWDDVDSLTQCSLVCRAWVPSIHLHLFRSITLPLNKKEKVVELSNVLNVAHGPPGHLSFAHDVKELTLSKSRNTATDPRPRPSASVVSADDVDPLDDILSRLSNVRSLTLTFNNYGIEPKLITSLPAHLQAVSTLRLEQLNFQHVHQSYYFTHSFPSLSSITVLSTSWYNTCMDLHLPQPTESSLPGIPLNCHRVEAPHHDDRDPSIIPIQMMFFGLHIDTMKIDIPSLNVILQYPSIWTHPLNIQRLRRLPFLNPDITGTSLTSLERGTILILSH